MTRPNCRERQTGARVRASRGVTSRSIVFQPLTDTTTLSRCPFLCGLVELVSYHAFFLASRYICTATGGFVTLRDNNYLYLQF